MDKKIEYIRSILSELRALQHENEWVEFKCNNKNPEEIGSYISALSNSASICGKAFAYMIWGVDDDKHSIIGTSFKPKLTKKGNEELESWLLRLLSPKLMFNFYELDTDNGNVVILEIERATHEPIKFMGIEYIRIGSYKKKLKDHPEKERELWKVFDQTSFEERPAIESINDYEVLQLLDYPTYFELLGLPLPEDRIAILDRLIDDSMVERNGSKYNITNLGAILFAKKLSDYKYLKRKAVRVIVYKGIDRIETLREQEGNKGYAAGFEGLISFIDNLLPRNEVIENALRKSVAMYPELAVRELVANAIIHQDFSIRGTGPMIEIFSNRMEITNPGIPLVKTERFLDSPPKSRNESLASFMRRIGICEERGSGFDKIVYQSEFYQLPPPQIELTEEHTKLILFSYREFNEMDKHEKIHACYLHACLRYVMRDYMTNTSLRRRFGIDKGDVISRIIKNTINDAKIKAYDPDTAFRYMKYVPFWA